MTSFADLLKRYMGRTNASSYWLAKRIDMTAPAIDNWRNGKAKPAKKDKVLQCAHHLRLDESETNAFLKAAGFGEAFVELHEQIYADYLQKLLAQLKRMPMPVLLLTTQAGWGEPPCRKALLAQAERVYGAANVLALQPPYSVNDDRYFSHLGRACGFEDVEDGADFEAALQGRLEQETPVFLLISRFEQGARREELAGILRNLCEIYDEPRLHIILAGAEKLLALKYAHGSLSLLNLAKDERWPALGLAEVKALYTARYPDGDADDTQLEALLSLSGGHPQLLARGFALHQRREALSEAALAQTDAIWQAFVPLLEDPVAQQRLCGLLAADPVAAMAPFILDPLVRYLYWHNLLSAPDGRRLQWRCAAIRQAGRKIFSCTDSGS